MPVEAKFSPTKGRLFFALLQNNSIDKKKLEKDLAFWGAIEGRFSLAFFPMAEYYEKEMGPSLKREFVLIDGLFERQTLVDAKKWSMQKERDFSTQEKRNVNIDPGLLCLEQALLISTKPYAHRIYTQDNLYIELLYTFQSQSYQTLPWTYPDYSQKEVIEKFNKWRAHNKN